MKLCVPTLDDAGPAAALSAHFGSAPFFALIDTRSHDVELVANTNARHAHGAVLQRRSIARGDRAALRGPRRQMFEAGAQDRGLHLVEA